VGFEFQIKIELMSKLAARILIIAAVTIAGGIWLHIKGPIHVIRITTEIEAFAPFWYMLSAFPFLGMLLADLLDLYRDTGFSKRTLELACTIIIIVALSNLRLGIRLPISGHSLLVSYFLFRRFFVDRNNNPISRIEILLGIFVLAMLTYIKLFWWTDPITLGFGCILGFGFALIEKTIISKSFLTQRTPRIEN
jgi:hypothetical protein